MPYPGARTGERRDMHRIRTGEESRRPALDRGRKLLRERTRRSYERARSDARDLYDDNAATPEEYARDRAEHGAKELGGDARHIASRLSRRGREGGIVRKGELRDRADAARKRQEALRFRQAIERVYSEIREAVSLRRAGSAVPAVALALTAVLVLIMPLFLAAPSWGGGAGADALIVEVALSQVGNEGGEPYWSWYGFKTHVDWCACFVSWCADRCGYLESGDAPKFAVCGDGMEWFQKKGQWTPGGIAPEPGMIIFFDWEEPDGRDGNADHVGIVVRAEEGRVETVEGNSGDTCARQTYNLDDPQIMGYGRIDEGEKPANDREVLLSGTEGEEYMEIDVPSYPGFDKQNTQERCEEEHLRVSGVAKSQLRQSLITGWDGTV